ncbi:MAG TPA: 30S ribosomal protein S6e [Candidatus Aenigmarchaeota archaeon]|nr:30S ribosomal protein S6e [Candidatus Aenigmarchaeota archaeon]
MATFKFVISDGKRSWQIEKDQKDAPVLGKKLGEVLDGAFLGLDGYELQITGGSDKDGFPMRNDIEGQMRKRFLITKGVGFHTDVEGLRKRKMLRGNLVGDDIAQINCKVVKQGEKPLEEILGKKEAKEEVKTE